MKWRMSWALFLLGFNLSEPTLRNDFSIDLSKPLASGDLVIVPGNTRIAAVYLAGRKLTFLRSKNLWLGVAPKVSIPLVVSLADVYGKGYVELPIKTQSAPHNDAPTLRLPASVWQKVSDKFSEERKKDRRKLGDAMARVQGELPLLCWQTPLNSRITSPFGSPRKLPNGEGYNHAGEDRRAAIGTPVRAAGSGEVVLAESMIVPGMNVVVSHGAGWYSRYLHFSEISVAPGAHVLAGQIIGKSGATGRVEAPHLHWEILWQGLPANPERFLKFWNDHCEPT